MISEDAFSQISVVRHEKYHTLYCFSDLIDKSVFLSDSTLYRNLYIYLKIFY